MTPRCVPIKKRPIFPTYFVVMMAIMYTWGILEPTTNWSELYDRSKDANAKNVCIPHYQFPPYFIPPTAQSGFYFSEYLLLAKFFVVTMHGYVEVMVWRGTLTWRTFAYYANPPAPSYLLYEMSRTGHYLISCYTFGAVTFVSLEFQFFYIFGNPQNASFLQFLCTTSTAIFSFAVLCLIHTPSYATIIFLDDDETVTLLVRNENGSDSLREVGFQRVNGRSTPVVEI